MDVRDSGHAGATIEITPAMVDAGVTALEVTQDSFLAAQATAAFQAMLDTLLLSRPDLAPLLLARVPEPPQIQ